MAALTRPAAAPRALWTIRATLGRTFQPGPGTRCSRAWAWRWKAAGPAAREISIYTRTGDKGTTKLVGGAEVAKDHPRIEAYGTVDELNAVLGMVRSHALPERLDHELAHVQDDLFNVGTDLATPEADRWEGMHRVGDSEVERLESWIDAMNADLPPLREFILPGGGPAGATLHLARTVCRRAERVCVARGEVRMAAETLRRIADGDLPKGDVLATARLAGNGNG